MKRWSLDARSRRRSPQALCVGVKEEFADCSHSEGSRSTCADSLQGETVDKSTTHRENPASSSWIHRAGHACQYISVIRLRVGVGMKHQYFADRRDFLKYELLLDLVDQHHSSGRLLSILMLTPNDDTAEGSVKTYEQGLRRRELFEFLKRCLAAGTRNVSLLRSFMRQVGVDYQPYLDDHYFEDAHRGEYFRACAATVREHSLIFFDPDIGLQTGTPNYMRGNGIEKYLMYADVSTVAHTAPTDSVIVVYQHLQKNKNRILEDIDTRCRDLSKAVGSSSTTFVTDRDVAFLVTSRGAKYNLWARQAVSSHGVKHGLEVG